MVNADDARALAMAGAGRARVVRFARDARIDAGVTVADGWIVERGPDGRHQARADDRRAADRAAPAGRRAGGGDHRARWRAPGPTRWRGPRRRSPASSTRWNWSTSSAACGSSTTRRPPTSTRRGSPSRRSAAAWWSSWAAASRAATSGCCARARVAGRDGGGDWRSPRRCCTTRSTGRRTVRIAASMADAVRAAMAAAPPGGSVLLAPACASFDMFENYAARGRAFKAEVAALGGRNAEEAFAGANGGVSREQSSVGSARRGAGCWDPTRPRAGSWCPGPGSD